VRYAVALDTSRPDKPHGLFDKKAGIFVGHFHNIDHARLTAELYEYLEPPEKRDLPRRIDRGYTPPPK